MLEISRSDTIHIITGWNPGDARPGDEANTEADRRLHAVLVSEGCVPVRAIGSDPASDHAELSWAVTGLSDSRACAIGADFGQVAIFRVSDGHQTVIACSGEWELSRPF